MIRTMLMMKKTHVPGLSDDGLLLLLLLLDTVHTSVEWGHVEHVLVLTNVHPPNPRDHGVFLVSMVMHCVNLMMMTKKNIIIMDLSNNNNLMVPFERCSDWFWLRYCDDDHCSWLCVVTEVWTLECCDTNQLIHCCSAALVSYSSVTVTSLTTLWHWLTLYYNNGNVLF